jgi:hypothetical protein
MTKIRTAWRDSTRLARAAKRTARIERVFAPIGQIRYPQ